MLYPNYGGGKGGGVNTMQQPPMPMQQPLVGPGGGNKGGNFSPGNPYTPPGSIGAYPGPGWTLAQDMVGRPPEEQRRIDEQIANFGDPNYPLGSFQNPWHSLPPVGPGGGGKGGNTMQRPPMPMQSPTGTFPSMPSAPLPPTGAPGDVLDPERKPNSAIPYPGAS